MPDRVMYVVGCAAPPVCELDVFVRLLQPLGWDICVIPTPTAARWLDTEALATQTGFPVRSNARHPDDPTSLPHASAMLVAPATFNTVNKLAGGVSDSFALGLVHEAIGLELPVLVMPYAKPALASHPLFAESLSTLQRWGVRLLANELIRPPVKGQPFRWQLLASAVLERLG